MSNKSRLTTLMRHLLTQEHDGAFFWASYRGAEIDLVLRRSGGLFGVECKRQDAPRMTRSMGRALEVLEVEKNAVVYPGSKRYPIAEQVEAVPLAALAGGNGLF